MDIKSALDILDPENDDQWTGNGTPRMDIMQKLTQTPNLTREQVTNASPQFTRDTAYAVQQAEATPEDPESKDVSTLSPSEEKAEASEDVMVKAVDPAQAPTEATERGGAPAAPAAPISAPATPLPPANPLEALQATLKVHEAAMSAAQKVKDDAMKAAKVSSDEVNAINRKIDALIRVDPQVATKDLRNYIRSQNDLRMQKYARVKVFMGDSKTTPAEVAKQLEVRSPLDKAMHGRKPPRGALRPVPRHVQPVV